MRKEFNYDEFRRIVDDSGYEEAMNYFKNSNLLFKEKLELIARLEEDYHLMGVSITVEDEKTPSRRDLVDYVLSVTVKAIDLFNRRERGEIQVQEAVL